MRDISDRKEAEEALRSRNTLPRDIPPFRSLPGQADTSRPRTALSVLHDQGHQDLAAYIDAHPEFVARALHLATVVDVNETTVRLFEAKSREELLGPLDVTFYLYCACRLCPGRRLHELNTASSMT